MRAVFSSRLGHVIQSYQRRVVRRAEAISYRRQCNEALSTAIASRRRQQNLPPSPFRLSSIGKPEVQHQTAATPRRIPTTGLVNNICQFIRTTNNIRKWIVSMHQQRMVGRTCF